MTIRHVPANTNVDAIQTILAEDGVVVVDNLVAPAVMDQVRKELAPFIEKTPVGSDDFTGRRTRRTGGLIARSVKFREIVQNPLVLATARGVLSHSTTIQLHLTQLIGIGPGEPAQQIHRDQWAFDFFPFPKNYEVQCNTIWAMTDFTEENGATRVIPKSNHFDDKLEFGLADTEPAEMTKGSVLFYTGSLYHGAGANRSRDTRCGINVTYCVSWLRQEENQYLSTPFDVARTLPVDLLKLMGYARGAYALGYVDDGRDPLSVLRPDIVDPGLGDLSDALRHLKKA
jgi:ectoine hydroxylase-related dioxygenase (phytanoyl-CoA dioxygenase family)